MFTLISFFTQEWKYIQYGLELIQSCKALKVPYNIIELPSTGSYLGNTRLKPFFIKECLEAFKSPVAWIDCDSVLTKYPSSFESIPDDAVMAAKKNTSKKLLNWYAGILWFRYCPESIQFINEWIRQLDCKSGGDHTAMERALKAYPIKVHELPKDYGVMLKRNEEPTATISFRISDWPQRNQEMKKAEMAAKRRLNAN